MGVLKQFIDEFSPKDNKKKADNKPAEPKAPEQRQCPTCGKWWTGKRICPECGDHLPIPTAAERKLR